MEPVRISKLVCSTPGLMLRVSKTVDGVWSKRSSSEASGVSLGSVYSLHLALACLMFN